MFFAICCLNLPSDILKDEIRIDAPAFGIRPCRPLNHSRA